MIGTLTVSLIPASSQEEDRPPVQAGGTNFIIPTIVIEPPAEEKQLAATSITVPSSEESKSVEIAKAALNLTPVSSGVTTTLKYWLGFHRVLQGIGLIDKALLAQKVISDLTGKLDLGKKFKSYTAIQNKICHLIEEFGAEWIERQLASLKESPLYQNADMTVVDVLRALDRLEPNPIPEIEWSSDIVEQVKDLQPGDIVFFRNIGSYTSLADIFVINGQWLSQFWSSDPFRPLDETFSHVGIYVGNGQIAEAQRGLAGEDVRVLSFTDPYMHLQPGSGWQYVICRPKNKELAVHAANIARQFAEDKSLFKEQIEKGYKEYASSIKTQLGYSQLAALHSIFKKSEFILDTKKRALTQIIHLCNNIKTPYLQNWAPQGFYCSFLVAECLQQGNLALLVNQIEAKTGKLPVVSGLNSAEDSKIITEWVNKAFQEHPNLLDELTMQFDPQYMSPQKLWQLVNQYPDQFAKIVRIVPPSKA